MPISVGPAGKVGDGVNAYYVFKVTSDMFSIEPLEVDRRYSDFLWLHNQLSKQCAGYIIPPLPAKVVGILQGPEFLERRRSGLERFLKKVVEHDELKNTNCFKSFLECSPVELTALKAASQRHDVATTPSASSAVTQRTQALNSWWGKAYQRMAENDKLKLLAAKAGRDLSNGHTIEDPEFDRLMKYVNELNAQVKTLNVKVQTAHKQNRLAAGAYCELIENLNSIADTEEAFADSTTMDFGAMLSVLDTRARQIDVELDAFSMAVDDFTRWVGAVVIAVNVREDRRFVYQAKLSAKSKTNESDRELMDAKEEYERVHARVMSEVARFRQEKAVELRQLFVDYARLQLRFTTELGNALASSLEVLEAPLPQLMSNSTKPTMLFQQTSKNPVEDNQRMATLEETALKMEVHDDMNDPLRSSSNNNQSDLYSDVCL